MTFQEARAASLLGLKVRKTIWDEEEYIFNIINTSDDNVFESTTYLGNTFYISYRSMSATDWEIYTGDTK